MKKFFVLLCLCVFIVGCPSGWISDINWTEKAHDALDTAGNVHDSAIQMANTLHLLKILSDKQYGEVMFAAGIYHSAYLTAQKTLSAYESAKSVKTLTDLQKALTDFYVATAELLKFIEILEDLKEKNKSSISSGTKLTGWYRTMTYPRLL